MALLQHADDLDYLQNLITSLSKQVSVNPAMNAVVEAFSRRRLSGRFKTGTQSVELDLLLKQGTKSALDDDVAMTSKLSARKPVNRLCLLFQKGNCTWSPCVYAHRCQHCNSKSHGQHNCPKKQRSQTVVESTDRERSGQETNNTTNTSRPPHPRYRRDRANDSRLP